MKKLVSLLTAVLALALIGTMPAVAAGVLKTDGKLAGEYKIQNGNLPAAANLTTEVNLAVEAEEEGWRAEAELGNLIGGATALGEYQIEFRDPRLNLSFWGLGREYQEEDLTDPFEFITSAHKYMGNLKARAIAGPLTVDFEDDGEFFVFGEKEIAGQTLGIAAHHKLPLSNGFTALGYDRINLAGVELTAGVGVNTKATAPSDLAYAVKAEVPVPVVPELKAIAQFKIQPAGFNGADEKEIKLEGVHETDLLKVNGSFANAMSNTTGAFKRNVVEATAEWRGAKGELDWDEQFESDEYFKNTAPAVRAQLNRTTTPGDVVATKIAVAGTSPIIPGQVWVLGSLVNEPEAKRTEIKGDGYIKMSEKIILEPGVRYEKAPVETMELIGKATYQMNENGKVWAKYAQKNTGGTRNDEISAGYEVLF